MATCKNQCCNYWNTPDCALKNGEAKELEKKCCPAQQVICDGMPRIEWAYCPECDEYQAEGGTCEDCPL